MLLSSLLLISLFGVLVILMNKDNGVSLTNVKLIALTTSIVNLFISLVIFILFNFSTNQFQFVQEYHEISYFDFYLGVDGLSIYFVLLTTIIIPISLLSNWTSISINVQSYIVILFLEALLLAVFLVLVILAFLGVGYNNIPVSIEIFRWIDSESLKVWWEFNFYLLIVSILKPLVIVSSLVHIYSIGYMSNNHRIIQIVLKTICNHLLFLVKKILLKKFLSYITQRFTILLQKHPSYNVIIDYYLITMDILNIFISNTSLYLYNVLTRYPKIYSVVLYLYLEYISIVEGRPSKKILFIITLYVLTHNNNIILFFILLFCLGLKLLLDKPWVLDNYPFLSKILSQYIPFIITLLIFYFLDCIWVELIIPFVKYLWHTLKMDNSYGLWGSSTNPDLGNTPGQNPNMGPNEPSDIIPVRDEKSEKKRIKTRNWRWKAEDGRNRERRKPRINEKLYYLTEQEKKERQRQQKKIWCEQNIERVREQKRAAYKRKVEAEGMTYKPHNRVEQPSQSVKQFSQPVEKPSIQTPRYSGWTPINMKK